MVLRAKIASIAMTTMLIGTAPIVAVAEFYAWTDENGNRRISNIPPQGVNAAGQVEQNYHPYSVPAQHARMREKLERQADFIAAKEAAANQSVEGSDVLPFSLDLFRQFKDPAGDE
jgi:hypothetical protein